MTWNVALTGARTMVSGNQFSPPAQAEAYFTQASSGILSLEGGRSTTIRVPLANVDLLKLYVVKAIRIVCHKASDAPASGGGGGGMTYELAIPWSRLAPFRPQVGADLGLSLIVNEDDGRGRTGFMAWFGNPNTKEIDLVGDLILTK